MITSHLKKEKITIHLQQAIKLFSTTNKINLYFNYILWMKTKIFLSRNKPLWIYSKKKHFQHKEYHPHDHSMKPWIHELKCFLLTKECTITFCDAHSMNVVWCAFVLSFCNKSITSILMNQTAKHCSNQLISWHSYKLCLHILRNVGIIFAMTF